MGTKFPFLIHAFGEFVVNTSLTISKMSGFIKSQNAVKPIYLLLYINLFVAAKPQTV